jgi:hypothetical protein
MAADGGDGQVPMLTEAEELVALRQQLAQVQAQRDAAVANQEATATQARQAVQASATQATVAGALAAAKPQAPAKFAGKLNELPNNWLFQMKQYFAVTKLSTAPSKDQVTFAALYLSGTAAVW